MVGARPSGHAAVSGTLFHDVAYSLTGRDAGEVVPSIVEPLPPTTPRRAPALRRSALRFLRRPAAAGRRRRGVRDARVRRRSWPNVGRACNGGDGDGGEGRGRPRAAGAGFAPLAGRGSPLRAVAAHDVVSADGPLYGDGDRASVCARRGAGVRAPGRRVRAVELRVAHHRARASPSTGVVPLTTRCSVSRAAA